jgi:hypothetical protein
MLSKVTWFSLGFCLSPLFLFFSPLFLFMNLPHLVGYGSVNDIDPVNRLTG